MNTNTTLALLACTFLCTQALAQQKGTFTDARDGKIYKTVKIGKQVWMAENLNYEAGGFKCYNDSIKCYNDSIANCDKYGKLYNWDMAMKACPSGWHLPSKEEWEELTAAVGGAKIASKYLKATSGWKDYEYCEKKDNFGSCQVPVVNKSGNGTDDYGFSAMPGGSGGEDGIDGDFHALGYDGLWWIASEYDSYYRYYWYINNRSFVNVNYGSTAGKDHLFSVRCLQNIITITKKNSQIKNTPTPAIPQQKGTFTDTRDKKTYKTVKIGEQVWMAENLNYDASGSKCYEYNTANCERCGRLYNWKSAMKACPKGWHLPSDAEWFALIKSVDPSCSDNSHCADAGTKLKTTSGWENYRYYNKESGISEIKLGNGEDKYGFSALPGGNRSGGIFGEFYGAGYNGDWWSSSERNSGSANYWYMYNDNEGTGTNDMDGGKSYLYSVRCIQDPAK